jgi:hypothetical protein
MMLSCPSSLYQSHITAILGPVFEHLQFRFQCSWFPILGSGLPSEATKPLFSLNCADAANQLASIGVDQWLIGYYARGGLFVGDLDSVTAEAMSDKARVELTRTFSDMIQNVRGRLLFLFCSVCCIRYRLNSIFNSFRYWPLKVSGHSSWQTKPKMKLIGKMLHRNCYPVQKVGFQMKVVAQ